MTSDGCFVTLLSIVRSVTLFGFRSLLCHAGQEATDPSLDSSNYMRAGITNFGTNNGNYAQLNSRLPIALLHNTHTSHYPPLTGPTLLSSDYTHCGIGQQTNHRDALLSQYEHETVQELRNRFQDSVSQDLEQFAAAPSTRSMLPAKVIVRHGNHLLMTLNHSFIIKHGSWNSIRQALLTETLYGLS